MFASPTARSLGRLSNASGVIRLGERVIYGRRAPPRVGDGSLNGCGKGATLKPGGPGEKGLATVVPRFERVSDRGGIADRRGFGCLARSTAPILLRRTIERKTDEPAHHIARNPLHD